MHSTQAWRADPSRKLIFMFSGQGSHYFQMGAELYQHQPEFRRQLLALNGMARQICGVDVIAAIYDGSRKKSHVFDELSITHPAIYILEIALARTLMAHGVQPDGVLGVSMGNFAAATVAGSLTAEQALGALARQARALAQHAEPGAMLALLGAPTLYHQHALLREHSDIAAINTPASFVLSLLESSRATLEDYLRQHHVNYQRMAVTRAFHSRWIDPAASTAQWPEFMAAAQLPWFCTTHVGLIDTPSPDYLWTVVRQPIQMISTLRQMESRADYDYLDLGPSGTLAVVLKYLLAPDSRAQYMTVMSAFGSDLERFNKVTNRVIGQR